MMKTPHRELHDYISEICEHVDVRAGSPLPLGTQENPVLSKERFYGDDEIHWFGLQGRLPNWADTKEKVFACLIHEDEQSALCLMFNAGTDAVDFRLPPVPGAQWRLAVDTSQKTPHDLFAAGEEPLWKNPHIYQLGPRSSVILLGEGANYQKWTTAEGG